MSNKFFDYQYDEIANELTESLVEEITTTLGEIELKSAAKLNKYFEKKVNEKCEEIISEMFSDAALNFNTSDEAGLKVSLDVWSDAELIYTFDLQKAIEETVDFLEDDSKRRNQLANIFRRFAERLEAD